MNMFHDVIKIHSSVKPFWTHANADTNSTSIQAKNVLYTKSGQSLFRSPTAKSKTCRVTGWTERQMDTCTKTKTI
jgi:hypothetical protein